MEQLHHVEQTGYARKREAEAKQFRAEHREAVQAAYRRLGLVRIWSGEEAA